jgi:hypothetical protein
MAHNHHAETKSMKWTLLVALLAMLLPYTLAFSPFKIGGRALSFYTTGTAIEIDVAFQLV